MFRSLTAAFAALFVLFSAGAVAAQTVGTATGGGTTSISNTQAVVGQRIVAPGAGLRLQSFRFPLARTTATLSVVPIVYEVTAGAATGNSPLTLTSLWTGAATPITNTGAAADYTFTPGITIALDPAKTYVVAVRQATPGETGNLYDAALNDYAPGDVMIENAVPAFAGFAGDVGFQATFAPAGPLPVPTLSEWAMIGLGLLLAGGAVLMIQRRRLIA